MLSELGQAALEWAAQGFYVFPIKPHHKRPPLVKKEKDDDQVGYIASRDPEQIKQWWTDFPLANIGCDCGKSNIVAVDFDIKHVNELQIEALKLVSGGRSAWDTRIHKTASAGYHYIFRPGELKLGNNSGTFGGPGIDTRDAGGYIVLPPSSLAEYSHNKYEVLQAAEPKPVPKALLRRKEDTKLEKSELEDLLSSQAPLKLGVRNSTLHRVCSKLLRIGFAQVEARDTLLSVNRLRCVPPLPENDILTIVESVYSSYKPVEDLIGNATEVEGIWNETDQAVAINALDFLREQKEETTWLIPGIFPTSTLNMVQGDAKSGKSTLTRHMAVAVSSGGEFLGHTFSTPAPTLFYSLQENKKQWKGWLERVLLPEQRDNIHNLDIIFRLGKFGPHAVRGLRARLKEKKYALVVIDMIPRFLSVKDLDKYAEMEAPLSDLNDIAEESGACIIWLHHERKSGGGFEAGIGSQAIRGAVYTTLKCKRENGHFSFSTEQREGSDTEETGLLITPKGLAKTSYAKVALSALVAKKPKR